METILLFKLLLTVNFYYHLKVFVIVIKIEIYFNLNYYLLPKQKFSFENILKSMLCIFVVTYMKHLIFV